MSAPDVSDIPDAIPRAEPKSRYGNPRSYVVFGKRYHTLPTSDGYVERGIASWYGKKFHGRRTSSGEVYNMYAMTAAHKSLPLPTYVSVTNLETNRRIVVRVNDRGPFHENRLIDLSYSAAKKLGIVAKGTGYVEVRALRPGQPVRQVAEQPPLPSVPGSVALYLQAGAFAVRSNAERVRERLQVLTGSLVNVLPAVVDGVSLYRVRVGPLEGIDHADRLTHSIVALGFPTPRIVIE
ncbi:MAG: septal ring lytic transglycosylase RlpA family protein [Gammaproteobacteria bacterium]|nr:septal ring lytic transglycosylase RlpA family protein [Gammaproteobacteria bacterium]